jgi:drug/metabolite transporter (DMT)-like permease
MSAAPNRTSTWWARLAALVAVTLWGLSFVATKVALRELSPITLVFTRFALGAAILHVILVARREAMHPPRSALGPLALLGFIGVFVHQMLQVHALTLTTAVRTGWLIGVIPIWSVLLATVVLGERLGARKAAGLLIGFAGAALVVTRGRLSASVFALPSTKGDLLILASTVNWAVYTVFARGLTGRIGSARAIAGSTLLGWAMLAPFFVREGGWRQWAAMSHAAVLAVFFLGIGCSGLAYLFWYGALARLDASRVSAFLYLEPLVTCAAAVPLLGEPLGAATIVGGLVVLLGVALVQEAERPKLRGADKPGGARE